MIGRPSSRSGFQLWNQCMWYHWKLFPSPNQIFTLELHKDLETHLEGILVVVDDGSQKKWVLVDWLSKCDSPSCGSCSTQGNTKKVSTRKRNIWNSENWHRHHLLFFILFLWFCLFPLFLFLFFSSSYLYLLLLYVCSSITSWGKLFMYKPVSKKKVVYSSRSDESWWKKKDEFTPDVYLSLPLLKNTYIVFMKYSFYFLCHILGQCGNQVCVI